MAFRQAEDKPEYPRFGAGKIDIGLTHGRDGFERTMRMGCGAFLHGGPQSIHRFADDAPQDFVTIPEMLVRSCGTDPGAACGFGHGKPVRTVRLDQFPHGRDQLRAQVPVVIGGLGRHGRRGMWCGRVIRHGDRAFQKSE